MTPPNGTHDIVRTSVLQVGLGFGPSESPYSDSPDHLTFDEMREMPMHMALGFDLED